MKGRHSFPHSVLYFYSRAEQGPQSSSSFPSAPGELGTLWDVPSSPLCSCTDTGDCRALPLGIPAERGHARKRKGQSDSAQDPLRSKTRTKTPCRAGSEHLASVLQPVYPHQIQITSLCISAMTGKGPPVVVPQFFFISREHCKLPFSMSAS